MKDKIAFICVGQAAGNIGELFADAGYNVFAINTSREDLSTLKSIPHSWHIPEGLGYAKDRQKAKEVFEKNFDLMVQQINNFVKQPIVYFIFSAGGGTGSGISPWAMDILINDVFIEEDEDGNAYPTKSVGAITILAADSESPKARENSYTCLAEISQIENLKNLFIIDNSKMSGYSAINRRFFELFTAVLEIPEKCKNKDGNIDQSEIIKVFSTPGVSYIAKVTGNKFSTKDLIDRIKGGIFADMNESPEDRTVQYVLSSTVKPLDYEMITSEFGQFVDEFHTFNESTNILMLTGMPFPIDKLSKMKDRLQIDSKGLNEKRSRASKFAKLDAGLNLFTSEPQVKHKTVEQADDSTPGKRMSSKREELLASIRKR